jgi:Spy/CpxP family protein refolding chaperone
MIGKSKTWAMALLAGALLLGGAAGVAVDRLALGAGRPSAERRGGERDRRAAFMDWLSQELKLSPEQRAQIEMTLERHREAVSAIWSETRPRYEQLRSQLRDSIRATLSEEQRQAYEALLQREEERRRPYDRRDEIR